MAVIEMKDEPTGEPNMVGCAQCSRTLPAMKRCTQCRAVLYCSRECQAKHWAVHKAACKKLPEDLRERAHKLAQHVKLQVPPSTGVEPTPSWKLGAPSDLDWARMEHEGAIIRGRPPCRALLLLRSSSSSSCTVRERPSESADV